MKIIAKNDICKFARYTQDDIADKREKIASDFANIFMTSKIGEPELNRQEAYDKINELMINAFYDDMDCFIYFAYDMNNLPISVAVFTENNHHFHLEMIATRESCKCLGYASSLCLEAFTDLANNYEIDTVTATVSKENYKSLYLQESLTRNEKIKFETVEDEDRIGFKYYIDGLVKSPAMGE